MVGDRWPDIEAGKSAVCKTILIRSIHDKRQTHNPDLVVDSLGKAVGQSYNAHCKTNCRES